MEVKKEDIIGYWFEREIVCTDCINDNELEDITQDEIITENDSSEDVMIFCDRCNKLIIEK
jgi:hypothetical protein